MQAAQRVRVLGWLAATAACATSTEVEPAEAPVQANATPPASAPATASNAAPAPNAAPSNAPSPSEHAPLVREIAAAYRSWGMVDDQFHWAPGLCAMPVNGVAHLSEAEPPAAHAEKVFLLYASDPLGYWKAAGTQGRVPSTLATHELKSRADVQQVLVKESFAPHAMEAGVSIHAGRIRPARKGEVSYGPGEPIGLFVMAQLRGAPAGTDEGWIYATVAADGTVREAGAIAACRDCHAKERDRIFGVPLVWK